MKHIYKLSVVLLAVFTFVGCNVDDDDAITVLPMTELTASLDQQVDIIAISDNATNYDLIINFSEDLPSYSTIEYSLDGGSSISSSVSTGDNTLVISIPFSPTDNFHDVNLSDFIVVNAAARRFTTSFSGNTSVRIMRQGYFSATISWEDASNDIDFGLQPMTSSWADTFDWIDTSLNFFPPEFLEGMLDDGNYAIYAAFYTAQTPVSVNYALETAGGTFSFDLLTTEDGNILWFSKGTDANGNVTYTFYTEDPS